jgi:formylmethanofuran dehydrogenase subunit E
MTTTFYRAGYEIPHIGERRECHSSVRVLVSSGKLTEDGKRLPLSERRRLLKKREGEIRDIKLNSGTFTRRAGNCEKCGEPFVGPPNRLFCDGCGGRKR